MPPPPMRGRWAGAPGAGPEGALAGAGRRGWVEVIAGPMFSGKSEELIRRIRRHQHAGAAIQAFKPALDDRYADAAVVSHRRRSVTAAPVADAAELVGAVRAGTGIVAVDEAQFLDQGLGEACAGLAAGGVRVIVAGLDLDYLGRPFGPVPELAQRADYATRTLAVCHVCGRPAAFSQRVVASDALVVLGGRETYEARCRRCFDPAATPGERLETAGN